MNRPACNARQRRGVAPADLLVVALLLAVFAGVALPSMFRTGEKAKRTYCQNNLRQLNMALRKYCMLYMGYFPDISEGPDLGTREYPVETMCRMMMLIERPFAEGQQPHDVIRCPACGVTPDDGEDYLCRHYAYNWHLDSYPHQDVVVRMDHTTRVGRGSFPADDSVWPHLDPGREHSWWASFQPVRIDRVTHPSRVCAFVDSNDVGPDLYAWHFNATSAAMGMVPTRHAGGGNMVFLDGHTEWHESAWFGDIANQPKWICGSDTGDPRVWEHSTY